MKNGAKSVVLIALLVESTWLGHFAFRSTVEHPKQLTLSEYKRLHRSPCHKQFNTAVLFADTTVIQEAAESGDVELVRKRILAGDDLEASHHYLGAALSLAASNGHYEICRMLIAAGACVNAQADSYTALMRASINGHADIAKLLVDNGAKLDIQRHDGQTALIFAAKFGHAKVVECLLDHNASMDLIAYETDTALIYAAFYGHTESVKILVEHGANTNQKNRHQETPLDIARRNEFPDIVRFLENLPASG